MAKKATKKSESPAAEVEYQQAPELTVDPHQFEGIKSLYLMVQNFKNISNKIVTIGGKSIMIIGRNEAGKSSLIQVMKGTMDSSFLPEEGLKEGEDHGKITHRIAGNVGDTYVDYTIEYYFDAKNRSGRIKVYDADGNDVKSPVSVIKSLMGNTSFSITKWLSDPKAKKLETLKKLTGKGVEIDMVNEQIKAKKATLKASKDRAEVLEAQLNNHGIDPKTVESHQSPIPLEPIQQEMVAVTGVQSQFDQVQMAASGFHNQIQQAQAKITGNIGERQRIADEMQRLQNALVAIDEDDNVQRTNVGILQGNVMEAEKWMNANPRPSSIEISSRMNQAIEHNNIYNQITVLAEKHVELSSTKKALFDLDAEVAKLELQRDTLISSSQLKVPGLGFTDSEVFLDGRPFDELQINTARKLHVSVQVAKALNPNYKGVFVDDGSLFDHAHLQELVKMIEEDGYFAVIELVDPSGGDLEVKFTEDSLFK